MKRLLYKGTITPDLYGTLYRNNLKYLLTESVGEITDYGFCCHVQIAKAWTEREMKDKRDCLKSLLKKGRYIIVKNHDRYVAIDINKRIKARKDAEKAIRVDFSE